ncbi:MULTISPECIES: DUF1934 domain-containing protein [unclassified Ruminococcus]|uniref:DUF1934 domain-containing protein n=1 Tax=unclassified Ruminococcus TaxID=2608920 RepID=UPI00210EE665|nr:MULTISPECIES: DUF1934 domain-containing protein [unclassified Ruminococcus]MCQ4023352.1 DUF1934 family protein [Ruminococcus sp. zg-924]MCQ4115368.1 DUF1934 family protein [Ruminococcus sp. zg-921]
MEELIRDYLIKITGKQFVDGESDTVVVETTGHYEEKDSVKYVYYKEYIEEDDGDAERDTTVEIKSNNLVSIIRSGGLESRLMLELDSEHQCLYQTPFGNLMITVFTSVIDFDLSEDGGYIHVVYSLNFSGKFGSQNEITIEIERLNK